MVGTLVKYMMHLWTQKHNFLTTYSFKSFLMGDSDCLHSIIFEANNLETLHLKGCSGEQIWSCKQTWVTAS
jgi:hypothetical protein